MVSPPLPYAQYLRFSVRLQFLNLPKLLFRVLLGLGRGVIVVQRAGDRGCLVSLSLSVRETLRDVVNYPFSPDTTLGRWSLSASTPPTALLPRTVLGVGSLERRSVGGLTLVMIIHRRTSFTTELG